MADATPARSIGQNLPLRPFQAKTSASPERLPTPYRPKENRSEPPQARRVNLIPGSDIGKARAALDTKRQQWAALNLRQEWADAAFMRGHLRVAGLRVNVSTEPATVERMKAKLRSIGVHSPEIQQAIGMPLARWLKVNPGLPLWAALALVLESAGRFTPEVGDDSETAGGAA